MRTTQLLPKAALVGLALLLTGCVFVPRSAQVYDENCGIQTRQMVLELRPAAPY